MLRMFALFLSFSIGFMSLGQEMLWFRIVSYEFSGTPQSFSFVLTLYLLGIAAGAILGKNICMKNDHSQIMLWGGFVLLIGGVLDLFVPYLVDMIMSKFSQRMFVYVPLIFLTSCLKASIFPIAHHLGSSLKNEKKIGSSVSIVYCANIIGATLGTIFFGLVILSYITTYQAFIYIGAFVLILAVSMIIASQIQRMMGIVMITVSLAVIMMNIGYVNDPRYFKMNKNPNTTYSAENRYGVIDIIPTGGVGVIYGGNVYDGIMQVDPINDLNTLSRVLILDVVHTEPKRALVIGVSGGAWLRMLSSFPTLETIDAIELNPGYVDAIAQYPAIAPVLSDKRITIHVDDGRRWLRRNSTEKYDLIVMNTTYHWRSGATNILSQEMMGLLSNALNENGIVALNSTRLLDVLKTTNSVFPYSYWGELGFIYSSHQNFLANRTPEAREKLYSLHFDGKPVFKKGDPASEYAIDRVMTMEMLDLKAIESLSDRPLEIIKDNNMINEYKYGLEFGFK